MIIQEKSQNNNEDYVLLQELLNLVKHSKHPDLDLSKRLENVFFSDTKTNSEYQKLLEEIVLFEEKDESDSQIIKKILNHASFLFAGSDLLNIALESKGFQRIDLEENNEKDKRWKKSTKSS